jgi:pimeloyl-ACP methyl ester carboxylesterase
MLWFRFDGREDAWIPVDRGKRLHEMIPGALLHEAADAGHLVVEEQAAGLLAQIRSFLQSGIVV